MAISKSLTGQHKRMAMGDLSVGFKKGGHVSPVEKKKDADDMKSGGSCGYKKGGSTKKGRK